MSFITENFLLRSTAAQKLYHEYAAELPIFDFHCHLIPDEIANDRRFNNITELWLGGDHYKWRLMRFGGVPEAFVMGDGDPKEKFLHFCRVLPYAIGNPVYHWSHLELLRFFDSNVAISQESAEALWTDCNQKIAAPEFSARQLMLKSNVTHICTSDDPIDTLACHDAIANDDTFEIGVYPTFRPDKALAIDHPDFPAYVVNLAKVAAKPINNVATYFAALGARIGFFHEKGCRMSDHGIDVMIYAPASQGELAAIFDKAMAGHSLTALEVAQFRTELLCDLASQYAAFNWTMQIHIGAMRSVNSRMLAQVGRDCGYDSPTDAAFLEHLVRLLDRMEQTNALPDTLLFSLDPNVDSSLATLAGNFPGDSTVAKVQLGPPWWHNDHKEGMMRQLTGFGNALLLGHFIGMTTDSRSFLSYPRHEYFRRVLCNFVGDLMEHGEYATDFKSAGKMVQRICYYNAKEKYFRD